jgi:two-component system, cell cycle sensor histidine kinase and response regulator CckA
MTEKARDMPLRERMIGRLDDDPPKAAAPGVFDQSSRPQGSVMMIMLVAVLVIAAPLIAVSIEDPERRTQFILAALAIGACIGIAALFAIAAGFLGVPGRGRRNDLTRAIADEGLDGLLVTDRDGRPVYANARYLAFSGVKNGSAAIKTAERLLTGSSDVSEAVYRLSAASREKRLASEDVRLSPPLTGSASQGWYRIKNQPLSGADGRTLWTISDLTAEREKHENSFQDLQRAMNSLENAPVGFFYSETDGGVSYINATLARWLGYDIAEVGSGGLKIKDFLSRDHVALIDAVTGKPGEVKTEAFDLDLKRRNGQVMAARLLHRVAFGSDGEPGPTHTVVLDRSARAETPPEGAFDDARFARYFNNTPMAIATVDRGGKIERSNALYARLSAAILSGKGDADSIFSIIAEPDRASLGMALSAASERVADIAPLDIALADGNRSARAFFSSDQELQGESAKAVIYLLETTNERKLQEQFAQSQKMNAVGQLAGGVAHDFNNMLQAILGFTEMLIGKHKSSDPDAHDLQQIRSNALRAAELVKQLLAFSRRQTLNPKVIGIGDTVSDLQNTLRRTLGTAIDIEVRHGRDLWPVRADATQLQNVLINLAVNARDAMPNGGKLTVRTDNVSEADCKAFTYEGFVPGEYVLIEVADTGTGMPAEVKDKIFEPFFTTKDVGKGTGLGLSTVYGIVKQTGGYIYVDSEIGKGTTFRIFLPKSSAEAEEPQPEVEKAAAPVDLTGDGSILLVEDEEAVRAFGKRALTSRGFTVHEAESGLDALRQVRDEGLKVDLIVSDVMMPEMDGPSMYEEIKKIQPDCKIIFVSGYAEEAFRNSVADGENFRFLPKPFSLKQLVETVKAAMAE